MFKIGIIAAFAFQLLLINSCSKEEVKENINSKLIGTWVLKSKLLGDAIDGPCGYATKNVKEITLKIEEDKSKPNTFTINGQSTVNLYNGSMSIISTDTAKNITYIKMGTLGSTKMAGLPELMECETYLFDFLNQAPEIRITDDGSLNIGTFKKDNIPSRNNGTYLMYERKM
jgi:heat shock protein HslJ